MDDRQLQRYSRHLLLDEFGIEAQEKISRAKVLIVGLGGLGSPACLYLAAAGVAELVLADADEVDLTNLQRQIAHADARIGWAKVESAAVAARALNPLVKVTAVRERLEGESLFAHIQSADVVLDCTDRFESRHAINRACVAAHKPLVSGAALRWDGQLSVFDTRQAQSPCYHCVFPARQTVAETSCALMGVFAPLAGLIGTMQAGQALQVIGEFGRPLVGQLLMFNGLTNESLSLSLQRDPKCEVCGSR